MPIEHRLVPRNGSIVMFMLVRRPDGGPTGYPMTGMLRDGELEVTTYRKAAKARYMLADDRVCCVVPDPDHPGAGVALHGHARPVEGASFLSGVTGGAAAIEVPREVRETVRDRVETQKRMVFRIDVVRTREIGPSDAAP